MKFVLGKYLYVNKIRINLIFSKYQVQGESDRVIDLASKNGVLENNSKEIDREHMTKL